MFYKILVTVLFIGICALHAREVVFKRSTAPAKFVNVNPDPHGTPWIVGGLDWSKESQAKMEKIPVLDLSHRRIVLPASLNNSKEKFFRPVLDQGGFMSCTQASSIGYILTYQINRIENTSANTPQTQLPPLFTYKQVFILKRSEQNFHPVYL